jgi:hypothetical protein
MYAYFAPGLRVDSVAIDVMTWKCRCCVMHGVVFLIGSFFLLLFRFVGGSKFHLRDVTVSVNERNLQGTQAIMKYII